MNCFKLQFRSKSKISHIKKIFKEHQNISAAALNLPSGSRQGRLPLALNYKLYCNVKVIPQYKVIIIIIIIIIFIETRLHDTIGKIIKYGWLV